MSSIVMGLENKFLYKTNLIFISPQSYLSRADIYVPFLIIYMFVGVKLVGSGETVVSGCSGHRPQDIFALDAHHYDIWMLFSSD
jgi:hypothetical protein